MIPLKAYVKEFISEYDLENRTYRTKQVNTPIFQILHLAQVSAENKKRNSAAGEQNSTFSVAPSGIEPVKLKAKKSQTKNFEIT